MTEVAEPPQTRTRPGHRRPRAAGRQPVFPGLRPEAFAFFAELAADNTHAWFHAHRERYRDEVDRPWRALVAAVAVPLRLLLPDVDTEVKTGAALSRINVRWPRPGAAYRTDLQASFRTRSLPSDHPAARMMVAIDAAGIRAGLEIPPHAAGWDAVVAALAAGGALPEPQEGQALQWTMGGRPFDARLLLAPSGDGRRSTLRYGRAWTAAAAAAAGAYLADEVWQALQEAAPWYVLAAGAESTAEGPASPESDGGPARNGVAAAGFVPGGGEVAARAPADRPAPEGPQGSPGGSPDAIVLPRRLREALLRRAAAQGVGLAAFAVYLLTRALADEEAGG